MTALSYSELVYHLFPRLTGGIRWGLERTLELLEAAGNPHQQLRCIHVAGTNGKGSVAASIESILTSAGLRTGLYSSPHLCSFRERIRINGEPIAESELLAVAAPLWPRIHQAEASFFEATTVLAFAALARARVDVALIEVGLGGRLDSTNVITPQLSVITNIAFDHAEYLGHTLPEIAREKAGIIKPGVPVVTGEADPVVVRVFAEKALAEGAPLLLLDGVVPGEIDLGGSNFGISTESWGTIEVRTPLIGSHQIRNAALAVRAVDLIAPDVGTVSRDAVVDGIGRVRWPGRFQVWRGRGLTWVFDVAHNEAGVRSVIETFGRVSLPRPFSLMAGILGDKDWERMLPPLFGLADRIVLTVPPTAPANRAWSPAAVLDRVPDARAQVVTDFGSALATAEQNAGSGGTVLVTGSFHTVGDAFALLGLCEVPIDFPLPHNAFSG